MPETPKNSIVSLTYSENEATDGALAQVAPAIEHARELVAKSRAANTRKAYEWSWGNFERWCTASGLPPAGSATPEVVATYLAARHKDGWAAPSLTREYSALAYKLRVLQPTGVWARRSRPHVIAEVLAGAFQADKGRRTNAKLPLGAEHLIAYALRPYEPPACWFVWARDQAIILFGFLGGFRRSELVALDVADLTIDDRTAYAFLRSSKTDQQGRGKTKTVARQAGEVCAVAALEKWLHGARITEGAVFRVVRNGVVTGERLSDKAVARVVKAACVYLGLDPRLYSGHSLRAGLVTQSDEDDKPIGAIMDQTGHSSYKQLREYIRRQMVLSPNNVTIGMLDRAAERMRNK